MCVVYLGDGTTANVQQRAVDDSSQPHLAFFCTLFPLRANKKLIVISDFLPGVHLPSGIAD